MVTSNYRVRYLYSDKQDSWDHQFDSSREVSSFYIHFGARNCVLYIETGFSYCGLNREYHLLEVPL